jgi:hypothetical protein
LRRSPCVKIKTVTPYKTDVLYRIIESVEGMKKVKSGKLKNINTL